MILIYENEKEHSQGSTSARAEADIIIVNGKITKSRTQVVTPEFKAGDIVSCSIVPGEFIVLGGPMLDVLNQEYGYSHMVRITNGYSSWDVDPLKLTKLGKLRNT